MRERAKHIYTWAEEGRADGPTVAGRKRRGRPSYRPRRVAAVTDVLPDLGLRRVECHVSGAPVLEPRESQAGCRNWRQPALSKQRRQNRTDRRFAVVGRHSAKRHRLTDFPRETAGALDRQLWRFV